jgi:hypothetical protein
LDIGIFPHIDLLAEFHVGYGLCQARLQSCRKQPVCIPASSAAQLQIAKKRNAGAKQVAEKPQIPCKYPEKHPAGAKAPPVLSATYGTTEVVP